MSASASAPIAESPEVPDSPAPAMFTAQDRCDRCGAQAFVKAVMASGDLLFCGHHGTAYLPGLTGALQVFTTTPVS